MTDGPFAPIGGGNGGGKRPRLRVVGGGDRDGDWAPAWPLAAGAPEAPREHPTLGAPSGRWTYVDAEGRTLGYVLRFDTPEGKQFRPLTPWRKGKAPAIVWRWISWSEPRPLYGLDGLAARPDAPVVVCEGEKSADAARRLLPGFVAIASPGGARAASKADWRPLAGRQVTVWRDADEPGAQYAADVASACAAARAASMAIAEPPDGVDEGWDAANAETDGWTPERAEAFVAAAKPVAASQPPAHQADEASSHSAKAPRRGVEAILALAARKNVKFWHSPAKDSFATVRVGDHNETFRLESREFARWLAGTAYLNGLTPPSKATLDDALRVFAALAINIGPEKEPFKRVGARDGKWYLDLGDDRWRVIEISASGWRILEDHDLPIIRSTAMRPLPEPEITDSGIGLLRGFIKASDDDFKLICAVALKALSPVAPYVILFIAGEHGSAKTTLLKMFVDLVDPMLAPERSLPKDETNLLVAAMHSHLLSFDNISQISGDVSDALCRLATGAGLSARTMYTNSDQFVFCTKNPIVMTGIVPGGWRPDLGSRMVVVRLKPIPDDERKTEEEHNAEWAAAKPKVFAVLLDALSCALRRMPDTKLSRSSRMADFERLIEASAPALDLEPGEFGDIYRRNQAELDATAIESDPVAGAIVALIEKDFPTGWEGNATRLYDLLGDKVTDNTRRSRAWPMSAISLGSRLERLKPVLRRNGVIVEKRHSGDRFITIRPATPPTPEN
jgi:hypothetical protein